jgi:3'-phosphoadenosine 5'-phosphosulfate sulfotransferase (PAPS reductase)/FAD synthetase
VTVHLAESSLRATNPYLIPRPALVSFSGGRTSAYMLWQIIQAHGGALPEDIVVAFANTGKEREETLRFVYEAGSRWSVPIRWVEWRDGAEHFEEVGLNSASRNGEPFAALIAKKKRLPNWQERWCTASLKVRAMHALMRREKGLEPGQYTETIGLRADEGMRILKGLERAEKDKRRVFYPLSRAKVVKADVMAFWRVQPFDLGLEPWEGNCDLCFMKGRGIRKRLIRDNPKCAHWWASEESKFGFFDRRDLVSELVDEVRRSPTLFDPVEDNDYDVECDLTCGGDEE